jgi:hypothetical protein
MHYGIALIAKCTEPMPELGYDLTEMGCSNYLFNCFEEFRGNNDDPGLKIREYPISTCCPKNNHFVKW